MAEPVPFAEASTNYVGPGCLDLPVKQEIVDGTLHIVSKWRLTIPEIEELNRTGCLWLTCLFAQPPIKISVTKPEHL